MSLRVVIDWEEEPSTHIEAILALEVEVLVGLCRVSGQIRYVARASGAHFPVSDYDLASNALSTCSPTADNLVLVIEPSRLAHRLDHLQHTHTLAATKVKRAVFAT